MRTARIVLTLLAISLLPVSHATAMELVDHWGSAGTGNGQFSFFGLGGSDGIAVGTDGSLYVTDTLNNRVQNLSPTGTFIAKWGSLGAGKGQFDNPNSVAVDSGGSVYVTDGFNDRVQKFTPAGAFVGTWGDLGSGPAQFGHPGPEGIATDAASNVYVADSGSTTNRIQKFTSSGGFLTLWGGTGSADGQLFSPAGVAVGPGGDVYVADWGNDRVQRFTPSGAFVGKWGSTGEANGQFRFPSGIATDSTGSVYVTDGLRVQRFSASGEFLDQWSGEGLDGDPPYASGIAVDDNDTVYVSDSINQQVLVLAPSPEVGKTVNVVPIKGKVGTKCKGESSFTELTGAKQIPVGCQVDTRKGTVRLSSAKSKTGGTQSGEFWDGRFRVKQKVSKKPTTALSLSGSLGCGKSRAAAAGRKKGKKKGKGRKLWGKGKGKFKTKGKKGSATVRGTTWLVADRCDNTTLFKVKQGTVKVRDKVKRKSVTLRKGKRYVAGKG